ncbi:hypothetical protein Emed_005490 [Eimeria media]
MASPLNVVGRKPSLTQGLRGTLRHDSPECRSPPKLQILFTLPVQKNERFIRWRTQAPNCGQSLRPLNPRMHHQQQQQQQQQLQQQQLQQQQQQQQLQQQQQQLLLLLLL